MQKTRKINAENASIKRNPTMRKPFVPEKPAVTLRPSQEYWQELFILAAIDLRSMPGEALALIHREFTKRFPEGLEKYLTQRPHLFAAPDNNGESGQAKA